MSDTGKPFKQVVLLILDGWGYRKETEYNAIAAANPQYFNYLWDHYPHTLIPASGEAVGLPHGNIGTSELGHSIIGAGTILESDMVRINHAIKSGTLKSNDALNKVFAYVKEHNSTLHFIGMLSPGGVHSHQDHLFAMLGYAKEAGVKNIAVHVFTDGRDEPPMSEQLYLKDLTDQIEKLGIGRISTMIGRFYAMDRDTNWDRIQKAEDMMFEGKGDVYSNKTPIDVINEFHKRGVEDQYIEPSLFPVDDNVLQTIGEKDGIINYNFRPDREREISQKIMGKVHDLHLMYVTITQYDKHINSIVIFSPVKVETTLSEQLAKHKFSQAHIAETEKYAHVTYFFNGGREKPYEHEEFIMIPSHKDVPTHDLAPHMRAEEIATRAIQEIEKGTKFIVLNLCNADMVGHTGKWDATVEAVKFEDTQIKRVVEAIRKAGGVAVITADHGNAEIMYDETTGQPSTAHTLDDVPAIITLEYIKMPNKGSLADIAPTILDLFGLPTPREMTGKSLVL